MDPFTVLSGGISLTRDLVQFLSWVRRLRGAKPISAMFDPQGQRLAGDPRIEVERHEDKGGDPITTWWFEVKPIADYAFVRFPLIESGIQELIGKHPDEPNPHARFWRWVPTMPSGALAGGTRTN